MLLTENYTAEINHNCNNCFIGVLKLLSNPNPANDQLNVSSAAIIEQWSLINSDGRVVHAANHESSSLSINLCELATGQYHLVLVTAKGISYQKFIKQ